MKLYIESMGTLQNGGFWLVKVELLASAAVYPRILQTMIFGIPFYWALGPACQTLLFRWCFGAL